ncbi:MAG: universal stress protein [Candidatus Thorarchaeota archaeon]
MEKTIYCAPDRVFCQIKRIMVGVDGSEGAARAATVAFDIGELTKSKVHIVYIIPLPNIKHISVMSDVSVEELLQKYEVNGKKILQGYKDAAKDYDIQVETLLDKGLPSDMLIALSEKLGVDLVILGSHGGTAVMKSGMGSSTERVVLGASCSVFVVK